MPVGTSSGTYLFTFLKRNPQLMAFVGVAHPLAINGRCSSPSRITLAFQQYFKCHAAEPRHTLSVPSSTAPVGAHTSGARCPEGASGAPTDWGSSQNQSFRDHQRSS